MSILTNDYEGLWRASANEGVPYAEDFPEALLVLTEFIDNSLGVGQASNIDICFDITDPNKCKLTISDDGIGIDNEWRMMQWASEGTGNNKEGSIYGHGAKKALTKFCVEYHSPWGVQWRTQDSRGNIGCLHTLHGPFLGPKTRREQDKNDEAICYPHGTKWTLQFNISVLGGRNTPESLMGALQEIIRSRYEPEYLRKFKINIEVKKGIVTLNQDSTNYKSLKQSLLESKVVQITRKDSFTIGTTKVDYVFFNIYEDGRKFSIPGMPLYGSKSTKNTRIHIGNNGRYIEAIKYSKYVDLVAHDQYNGVIGFIMCTGDALPIPCTTKVKFQYECPIFKEIRAEIKMRVKTKSNAVPAPIVPLVSAPVKTKPKAVPLPAEPPAPVKTKLKRKDPPAPILIAPAVPAPVEAENTSSHVVPLKTINESTDPVSLDPVQSENTDSKVVLVKDIELPFSNLFLATKPTLAHQLIDQYDSSDIQTIQTLYKKYETIFRFNALVKYSIETIKQ